MSVKQILLGLLVAGCFLPGTALSQGHDIPASLRPFIALMQSQSIGGQQASVTVKQKDRQQFHVLLEWNLKDSVKQDDWQISIQPAFQPSFHWAPHLTPTDDHIIAQHVFRSPALILTNKSRELCVVPDLDLMLAKPAVDWYMDQDARTNTLFLGMSKSSVKEHTAFVRVPGAVFPPGKLRFGFYILTASPEDEIQDPWRAPLAFMWKKWGNAAFRQSQNNHPLDLDLQTKRTYDWAFLNWKKTVWQEFSLNGKAVGAPQFIVNVTQSPNYPGEVDEREFRSIWNQAWFSSFRSAQGLYRYSKRKNRPDLQEYARKTKELALAFPQKNGFFPGLIATEMESVELAGKRYNRSKGWGTYYFGNSNRNPITGNPKQSPLHILDMSFTANQMLIWYQDLEKDERLLQYARAYADGLLSLQDQKGFFPAWLDSAQQPLPVLLQSPETSMSVSFLLRLYTITKAEKYKKAALRAMDAVVEGNLLQGQWEDFETYWSCSRFGSKELVGKKMERNDMFKQNNFCIFWTAEALLDAYRITANKRYLHYGKRTLDELLMTQASWQPPYIYVDAVGGFGVMNFDGEWNDARQSIFAELIVTYGQILKEPEYIQRGKAALRASFLMIYSPENPRTKAQWEARWPFFGPADYGFMMENYGHGGVTSPGGVGIGEFTIFDWGNGAAAEAYNRMVDRFGKPFLDKP